MRRGIGNRREGVVRGRERPTGQGKDRPEILLCKRVGFTIVSFKGIGRNDEVSSKRARSIPNLENSLVLGLALYYVSLSNCKLTTAGI